MALLLTIATTALCLPMLWLCAECAMALPPSRQRGRRPSSRPRAHILMPAHNEQEVLPATLSKLSRCIAKEDRVLVVADNCDDESARVAAEFGVGVVERNDPERRGKGFALDFGIRSIAKEAAPDDIVVIVDADCEFESGALESLIESASELGTPVQGSYLMQPPSSPSSRDVVSSFAVYVKNHVRPLGLSRMGIPCLLSGSGMAFPWHVMQNANLASGNIVEDMRLACDLSVEGYFTAFCPSAKLTAALPGQHRAAKSQRTRWEHGHVMTLLTQVPRLFGLALVYRSPKLAGLAMELSIPPLSMMFLLWMLLQFTTVIAFNLTGMVAPLMIASASGLLTMMLLTITFWRNRPPHVGWSALLAIPWYVVSKLPIYLKLTVQPQQSWIRTDRDAPQAPHLKPSRSTTQDVRT